MRLHRRAKQHRPIEFIEYNPTGSQRRTVVRTLAQRAMAPELPEHVRSRLRVIEDERFELETQVAKLLVQCTTLQEERTRLAAVLGSLDRAVEGVLFAADGDLPESLLVLGQVHGRARECLER